MIRINQELCTACGKTENRVHLPQESGQAEGGGDPNDRCQTVNDHHQRWWLGLLHLEGALVLS
jgi:hypothetical protein